MKFEKFLKSVGIDGVIYKASNGDLYLRDGMFGNVLMRIPEGMCPVNGGYTRDLDRWMDQLVFIGSNMCHGQLAEARLSADGTPKEIVRIYRDILMGGNYGNRICEITQDAYTLIEKYDDVWIFSPSVDGAVNEGVEPETPALYILSRDDQVVGIILGA